MTRIVRSSYRYKRPPGKKKPVAIEVPEVVRARKPDPSKRRGKSRAQPGTLGTQPNLEKQTPANDDRKPAIVTIRRKTHFGKAEDITVEEANRRPDLANEMFQDFERQIAEKLRK